MLSLSKIVGIVEVDDAFLVRLYDILRQKNTVRQILRYLACHVVSLGGVYHRVLVRVLLLHLFVHLVYKRQNAIIRGVRLTAQLSLISVSDILLGNLIAAHLHDALLYHILYVLDIHRMR